MLRSIEPDPIDWDELSFEEAINCQWNRLDPGEVLLPEEAIWLYGSIFLRSKREKNGGKGALG